MLSAILFGLAVLFALQLRPRLQLLEVDGASIQIMGGLALSFLLVGWIGFACYLAMGMTVAAVIAACFLLAALCWSLHKTASPAGQPREPALGWLARVKVSGWMLAFVALVTSTYYLGLSLGEDGRVGIRFNFADTAVHLTYIQAFLNHPHFPPPEMNVDGFRPLRYHFMSDFLVAFLSVGGWKLIPTLKAFNVLSGAIVSVVLWGTFRKFLRTSELCVFLACSFFLLLMPALTNLIHFHLLGPDFFPRDPLGVVNFPYFNFEYHLLNLFHPQRAMTFSFPAVCLALMALSKAWQSYDRRLIDELACLIALFPFVHFTSFMYLTGSFAILVWRHRTRFRVNHRALVLPAAVALLQLAYIRLYGAPMAEGYSGWDVWKTLPLDEYRSWFLPRIVSFWLMVDGEYLFFGAVALITIGCWLSRYRARAWPVMAPWFLLSLAFFVLINCYRYTINWGDSNKLVLFLNFWLTLFIFRAIQLTRDHSRETGAALLVLAALLVYAPFLTNTAGRLSGTAPEILFEADEFEASLWLRHHTRSTDLILTSSRGITHFVAPLAGRATFAGIYSHANPYTTPLHHELTARVYEQADRQALTKTAVKYIVVSRHERQSYQLAPAFSRPQGLVHQSGDGIRIYDAAELFR